ncbi:Site-specific recombinase XerD [Eubacterium callanderi]|uniref:Site-specific recombinase XerD n=1 Tax=Eubacterium callanderi TaxID=53442 RepID=A0AB74F1D8_9FIRM|nr:tyrosine-type recombinase/integrase [Eubacterium callanderi]MDY7112136.1 Tyrosine recombinase XerD [Eubacterium callanderi]SHL87869.1 Site-specific recombinase XerD [Eubacterium callanderi]
MPRSKYAKKVKNGNTYFFYRMRHKNLRRPHDLYGKSIPELEQKIDDLKKELDRGVQSDKVFFSNYLEKWLEDVLLINKKQATINNYRLTFKNYIENSSLNHIRLKEITAFDVQDFYKEVIEKNGAGKGTIATLKKLIHPCIRYAYTQGKILTDFSRSIIVPAGKEKAASSKRSARALSIQEEQQLREIIKGKRIEAFVITALGSGLRHGELLALTWDDVDLKNGVITVNKSYGGKNGVDSPKTPTGNRQVPIRSDVVECLKKHKLKQNEKILLYANKYQNNNLVFPNPTGGYQNASSNIIALKKLTEAHGIERITVHDFRDTYATRLFEQTSNLKMIQQLLGHSDISTTANEYTHVSLKESMQFIQALEDA